MQIKQQMLAQQVQKKIAPLYVLIGQDNYLLDESLALIKSALKKNYEYDEQVIMLQTAEDWNTIRDEANSYSLFSDTVFLNLFSDKKSIDAAGKKVLTEYLKAINERCFIVIRAPNIPAKQIQWLMTHEQVVVVVAYPLNPAAMKNWIITELKRKNINFTPQVPEIIHHYTQGNMLACAQVIEKISLSNASNSTIDIAQAQEHLSDQCDHNLFELIDACLQGQGDKAIQILRHAANNKTEATLVLWMLTQEIRTLVQLIPLLAQMDIKTAAGQLKIWPQRVALYQACSKRLTSDVLQQLHRYGCCIDERIKSSLNTHVWASLEGLALSLCSGRLIGDVCTV